MEYRGYRIERTKGSVIVTDPNGETWTEDTIQDAKISIDGELLTFKDGDDDE